MSKVGAYYSIVHGCVRHANVLTHPPLVYDNSKGIAHLDSIIKIYGYEIAKVPDIYSSSLSVSGGTYLLSSGELPVQLNLDCQRMFPDLSFERYAFLKNVVTDEDCHGKIMFGYSFNLLDLRDFKFDFYPSLINEDLCKHSYNIEVYHKFACSSKPYVRDDCFIGITLDTIKPMANIETLKHNYRALTTPHNLNEMWLPRDCCVDILELNMLEYGDLDIYPSISFVPLGCHCCK